MITYCQRKKTANLSEDFLSVSVSLSLSLSLCPTARSIFNKTTPEPGQNALWIIDHISEIPASVTWSFRVYGQF